MTRRDGEGIRRDVVSYVRRSPRMNPSQRNALARLGPELIIPVARGELSTSIAVQPPLDLGRIFGRQAPLVVEIGSGTGDALVSMAGVHPDWNVLGFEVFDAAVASTLIKVEASGLGNVRLVTGDGVTGLAHLLAADSVDRLCTFFPDPWHKARHHKRRLVSTRFARLAASRVRPSGLWLLATDWDDYAEAMRAVVEAEPLWQNLGGPDGYSPRFEERPMTRFEARGIQAGRPIRDLRYRRLPLTGTPDALAADAPAHPVDRR